MSLVIIGFNHKSTSISLREKLSCSEEEQIQVMSQFHQQSLVAGVMVLSTCNRLELICSADDADKVLSSYADVINIEKCELSDYVYYYHDQEAFKHMIRVASGLDSMLLGETQIMGQFKAGFNFAKNNNYLDSILVNIIPRVFYLAKKIRSEQTLTDKQICYAESILKLTKSVFQLENKSVLFIGSGDLSSNIIAKFTRYNFAHIYLANRTFDKAEKLANKLNVEPINMKEINNKLITVDIVICAVSSPIPILGKGMVETALEAKPNRPILLIDLGVPRNIEPEVKNIAGAYLYNIDNLQDIMNKQQIKKEEAISAVESLVEIDAEKHYRDYKIHSAISVVKDFRSKIEDLRDETIVKSLAALDQGENAARVVETSLRQLTQKALHLPTINIRKAIAAKREDILQLTKDFFEL